MNLIQEIEARFDRVIVPLTEEQVSQAHRENPPRPEDIKVSEHIDYHEHAESDVSLEDAMAKLRAKVLAYLGDSHGKWIAWRVKPVGETEADFLTDTVKHSARLRFGYSP